MSATNAAQWLSENQARLAAAITDRQYAAHPELAERWGPTGRRKCETDARYHLEYLQAAVAQRATPLFTGYVAWAKVLLGGYGVGADDLRRNLEFVVAALEADAPPDALAKLLAPIDRALEALDEMPERAETAIVPGAPHAGLAKRYVDKMLRGERRQALALIADAAEAGVPVQELYLHVFQPAQHEIGRLWQHNEITVATEHYCTGITQLAISQLYPRIFSTDRKGRRLVATCIEGDLHELGVRMVADFFEMDGWDTFFLGSNVPLRDVPKIAAERSADVVAISATITKHVQHVADLVQSLRRDPATANTKVLAGGYPFNLQPTLWKEIGADGHALDAEQAVRLGNQLLESPSE